MDFKYITFKDHIEWIDIKFNRPEVFNALNGGMLEELLMAFEKVEEYPECSCVLLTGEGKAFCSGQDLKVLGGNIERIPIKEVIQKNYNPLIKKIRSIKVPVIAKINGPAVGAGCALALGSDLILASKDAYFAVNFIHLGLVPDAGTSYFLPRRVGYSKAFELATTGRKIFGEEAASIGLVDKCVEGSELDDLAKYYVDLYANAPSKALELIKQGLNKSMEMGLDAVLDLEANYQEEAGRSPDFSEGLQAFLEKRSPNFRKK